MKANLCKVKVVPKPLKSIPGILPNNKNIEGEPVELELSKDEIARCMNYADVYDMSSGEECHICERSFKEIVEYVEEGSTGSGDSMEEEPEGNGPTGSGPTMEEEEGDWGDDDETVTTGPVTGEPAVEGGEF